MPLLRSAEIRPGDSVETAPGEWTVARRVTVRDGGARVELDRDRGGPLLLGGGDPGTTWSVERPGRIAVWHVRPGEDSRGREVVWSHAVSV